MLNAFERQAGLVALRFWAEAGSSQLRSVPVSASPGDLRNIGSPSVAAIPGPSTWAPVRALVNFHGGFENSQIARLGALISEANIYLTPFEYPLTCDLGLHRWLRSEREESYSDWLAWVLRQYGTWRAVGALLGCDPAAKGGSVVVDREVSISYLDESGIGRLDLVVSDESAQRCVVEVKTRPFEQGDLEKHRLYQSSRDVAPDCEWVFIAIEEQDCDLHGFRFVSWSDVCIRLRSLAPDLMRAKGLPVCAMTLAFVAAIEQNVLKLGALPNASRARIVKTALYLQRFLAEVSIS